MPPQKGNKEIIFEKDGLKISAENVKLSNGEVLEYKIYYNDVITWQISGTANGRTFKGGISEMMGIHALENRALYKLAGKARDPILQDLERRGFKKITGVERPKIAEFLERKARFTKEKHSEALGGFPVSKNLRRK
ncbi:MAG TPA: hypothetical protein VFF13_02585 [archaeon]|nr:hypothetical protein [archaeon]